MLREVTDWQHSTLKGLASIPRMVVDIRSGAAGKHVVANINLYEAKGNSLQVTTLLISDPEGEFPLCYTEKIRGGGFDHYEKALSHAFKFIGIKLNSTDIMYAMNSFHIGGNYYIVPADAYKEGEEG